MRLVTRTVRCERAVETFRLHPITDVHDGARDHAYDAFERRVREIADDPRALWIGGGDYGDLIVPSDPRFTADTLDLEYRMAAARVPDFYLERLTERLSPIAGKCVGLAVGNHERTISKHYHRGVGAELASRLGVPHLYLGIRGWSVVVFENGTKRLPLRIYVWHGWSAGRLKGRKAIQAERELGAWDADVLVLGHDHQPACDLWYTEEVYGSKAGYRLRHRPRAYLNGGSWTVGETVGGKVNPARLSAVEDDLWVESRNFRPQPPGGPVLEIEVDFGCSSKSKGRPAGFSMRVIMDGRPFYPDLRPA